MTVSVFVSQRPELAREIGESGASLVEDSAQAGGTLVGEAGIVTVVAP